MHAGDRSRSPGSAPWSFVLVSIGCGRSDYRADESTWRAIRFFYRVIGETAHQAKSYLDWTADRHEIGNSSDRLDVAKLIKLARWLPLEKSTESRPPFAPCAVTCDLY